jgi:hypothetical protein
MFVTAARLIPLQIREGSLKTQGTQQLTITGSSFQMVAKTVTVPQKMQNGM